MSNGQHGQNLTHLSHALYYLLPLSPELSAAHTAPCSADKAHDWAVLV